ncbi:hypothetical protein TD95_005447 [Thielaviopsis punctulata]|uniref:Glycoside hydrolase family 5 domain-containing protein n=1 Tax=Thielaviopsis punctulata TaxID=72032 RepID=A0A0F4ZAS5_9PEZI|nr:hypothetical protein TD95_005447 [Thielaviopsis punctulata]
MPGILRVKGTQVVGDANTPVILRGAALGGWMNMENFITGFPGHEHQHRAAMLKVLGHEKYEFFFDKFLEYFFTEEDAKFFASLGLNCIRLPFNYRHFEDDMNPRVLKTSGFKHLDRVVDLCAKYNIYSILDMHALPGGQNPDWHCDSGSPHALFWDHKDFQDRTVWLWKEIAAHYKGNAWIAGYNLINEPCDPQHVRLPAFYARLESEIRQVDPDHILWLDGNTFSIEWKGFDKPLPNTVYSLHDYSLMGFPGGDPFVAAPNQLAKLESQFLRKAQFMHEHGTPIWNGEFGPVYEDDEEKPDALGIDTSGNDAETINKQRYNLLGAQLRVYDKYKISWSIWLYKDIGFQGMLYCAPDSPYRRTVQAFVDRKRRLNLDAWGRYPSRSVADVLDPYVKWIDENVPQAGKTYPSIWNADRHMHRRTLETFVADSLSEEFAALFGGMGLEELEACARSFAFEECVQREGLNAILREHVL